MALYPVTAQQISLVEFRGEMYCELNFANGNRHYIPYDELIHVRGHFYESDIFGSDNRAIESVIDTATTFNQSMKKFARMISVLTQIYDYFGVNEEIIQNRFDETQ